MVKTALNSKRKLIYSIKLYAFIIVQVVKFMREGCHANDFEQSTLLFTLFLANFQVQY